MEASRGVSYTQNRTHFTSLTLVTDSPASRSFSPRAGSRKYFFHFSIAMASSSSAAANDDDTGIDTDVDMEQLLLLAAAAGNLCLLKRVAGCLDEGEGMAETIKRIKTSKGCSALHRAAARGKIEICRYLIQELGIPVDFRSDSGGRTALHYAAFEGQSATVSYLIEQGADLTAIDDERATPLYYAADSGHGEVVELLLSKGVPVNPENSHGTPLLQAATNGDADVTKILLQHGADTSILMSGSMLSPLLCSILAGSLKCLKLLIEAGADLNLRYPLHMTVYKNKMDMMKCLLDAGADPNILNEDEIVPIELAVMRFRTEMIEILFPLTRPIPQVECWSIEGLYKHVYTEAFVHKLRKLSQKRLVDLKMKGADAFRREDFLSAVYFYDAAITIDFADATLFANLSLCYLKAGYGEQALENARSAQSLRPNWSKAYYRVGAALMLLKDYERAYRAFADGLKLNPTNEEIKKALQNALECMRKPEL